MTTARLASHAAAGITEMSPAQTYQARGTARLIDVREAAELTGELGHIAGVEHVPLATVAAWAFTWRKDETLILICRSGARSTRAAEALLRAGYSRICNMSGGMLAYNASGLPLETR